MVSHQESNVMPVEVSQFLLMHPLCGPKRGARAVIVGKSVHNQWIERMWRNVYQGVLGLYYNFFSCLETKSVATCN